MLKKVWFLNFMFLIVAVACQTTATSPVPDIVSNSVVSPVQTRSVPVYATATLSISPTLISSKDYKSLAYHYLELAPVPTPTFTPVPDTWSSVSSIQDKYDEQNRNIADLLAGVEIRVLTDDDLTPPPVYLADSGVEVAYIQAATDLMNITQADPENYLKYLHTWAPNVDAEDLACVWIYEYDLDQDGQLEWLVSVPIRYPAFKGSKIVGHAKLLSTPDGQLGCFNELCSRLVIVFENKNERFIPVDIITSRPESYWIEMPDILLVEDLNQDGTDEIFLESKWKYGSEILIGIWDGINWKLVDWINQISSTISFQDWDNDGIKDIVFYGEFNPSAVIQRLSTSIYSWKQGHYIQIAKIPDSDPHPYFRIIDANIALKNSQPEVAEELALSVLNEASTENCAQLRENRNLIGYAGIEVMLSQLLLYNKSPEIPLVFNRMEDGCEIENNLYIMAAQILKSAYEYSQDTVAACYAMENYIVEQKQNNQTQLRPEFFYNFPPVSYSEESIYKICPL